MLIKGYIESTQSMIVIIIYKHIVMYINIYILISVKPKGIENMKIIES